MTYAVITAARTDLSEPLYKSITLMEMSSFMVQLSPGFNIQTKVGKSLIS